MCHTLPPLLRCIVGTFLTRHTLLAFLFDKRENYIYVAVYNQSINGTSFENS